MPFVNNLNPVLLDLGPLEIRYYGLVYVVGFIVVFLYFRHLIKHRKLLLTSEELYDLVFYLMVGVLVGSRLGEALFYEPAYYFSQPWKIFYVWEGGMSYHGGLIGVAIATYLFWRRNEIRKKVSFAKLADYISIPSTLMLAVGRIANFINGELPGTVTNVKWCVVFPNTDNLCRHPQQLYESALRFLTFGWLLIINTKKHKDGFIFWNMLLLMGLARVVVDFVRDDPRYLFGLTTAQYLSTAMVILGAVVLVKYYWQDIKAFFGVGK